MTFSAFGTCLGMSLEWVPIYMLLVSYPCFEIGENPNPVKTEKTRQIEFGLGG